MSDKATSRREDTGAARAVLGLVAGGAGSLAGQARTLAERLARAADDDAPPRVQDDAALGRAAALLGIEAEGEADTAKAVAQAILGELDRDGDSALGFLAAAPPARRVIWQRLGIEPGGIDRTVVDCLGHSRFGERAQDKLLAKALSASLAAGWGSSLAIVLAADALYGAPSPHTAMAGPGSLSSGTVNILVQDRDPAVMDALRRAIRQETGDVEIRLAGAGSAGCDALSRGGHVYGPCVSGDNGASVDLVVGEGGCAAPCPFDDAETVSPDDALDDPAALVREAVKRFESRKGKAEKPGAECCVGGFAAPSLAHIMGGHYRATFRPLNDALLQGRVKGLGAVVGCVSEERRGQDVVDLVKRLIKEDVLVLQTGCAALASASAGLMRPEAAKLAGKGLAEVCEATGLPPVISLGSCAESARLVLAGLEVLAEGGLGEDIAELPLAGAAPEWKSDTVVALGACFVASGVDVVLGNPLELGSEAVESFLTKDAAGLVGASFHVQTDPAQAAALMLERIEARRKALGIERGAKRKLFDMNDRRRMHV